MVYNTKQKQRILEIIKLYKTEFTVKDIYKDLNGRCGLTTIYRLVDNLCVDGTIKKIINNNNITYQYLDSCNQDNHFYLKCTNCGILIHIDCDCIIELQNHILQNHNFKLAKKNIIINGLCKKCVLKEN